MIPRMAVTVNRLSAGTYSSGNFTEGTPSTIQITASVQPTSPNDLLSLPEGRRNSKAYRLYSDFPLRMATNSNPDKVVLFSEEYEVTHAEIWQNSIINHYKYIVTKIGNP